MKNLHTNNQIDEQRKRLYERGGAVEKPTRSQLSNDQVETANDWTQDTTPADNATNQADTPSTEFAPAKPAKKRHYRSFVLIGSLGIFFFVAAVTSIFLYFGGNQISNDNIEVSVTGPSSIGGGEVTQLQVSVSNQNAVAIESATIILKYPHGTRSVGDSPRNLFEERIPIEDIEPGEVRNIPVQVTIFGEENADKNISATVEYRIDGSNGVFYKDSYPLKIQIVSSPLLLRVENFKQVASGQLVDVTLTAVSNASIPLNNILVTASYPNGFSFEGSTPDPVYGQNVWKIEEILPDETYEIKFKGIVTGLTEEEMRINFDVGPVDPENPYLVGSSLADAKADFVIERPFIDVDIAINSDRDRDVVIPEGQESEVEINITNTLDEAVYDMVVEVVPDGNALDERSVKSDSGFYDSNTKTVRWEVSNNASFERILPRDSRTLIFKVDPGVNRTTSSFDLVVNIYARRINEPSALEELIGSVTAEAKYSSVIKLGSQVTRNVGRFGDSGPIPPRVGDITTYTMTIVAEAGANDMTGTVVKTSLPVYVQWLDQYDAEGDVVYNPVSKRLEWSIGNIDSGKRKELTFQVSIQPSISQLKSSPILLNEQQVRANDRFTGALLQDSAEAVTTELSTEMGFARDNGEVIR